jgi:DNA-binding NtrC family response regulator
VDSGNVVLGRVFVVDDDPAFLRLVIRELQTERWEVSGFSTSEAAIEALERTGERVDVLLADVYMPGTGGLELIRQVRERWPSVTPVLMTGQADVKTAVDGLRSGAYDYLVKPFELDALVQVTRRAVERARLLDRNLFIQRQLDVEDRYGGLVGASRRMRDVLVLCGTVAPTDATVLVLGESGTGKELVARSIHRQSARGARPFIGINCGALSENVLESELFGHARGAFTGAVSARRGLFEEASGGTLFLDEVGELSPATQVRLLRVLQEGEVRPVGANRSVPVDVRIIAATNRDLRAEVQNGGFRRDLFYRLEVITIELPPLRERMDDLPALVHHLVQKRAARLGKPVTSIDDAVFGALGAYSWPGNVRELENVLERALVMAPGPALTADLLPEHLRSSQPPSGRREKAGAMESLSSARTAFERDYVVRVIDQAKGNLSEAARLSGVDPSNFRRLMRRLGISLPLSSSVG